MNPMDVYNELDMAFLEPSFSMNVTDGKVNLVKKMLRNPEEREKISSSTLFVSMIQSVRQKDLKMFNVIHKQIREEGIEINRQIYFKIFNSACGCESDALEILTSLDKRFYLSDHMMTDASYLNKNETAKGIANFFNDFSYDVNDEDILKNCWNKHGFVVVCSNGNEKLVDYLLSFPTKTPIPDILLETGFLIASEMKNYQIALKVYSKLPSISNSQFIKNYLADTEDNESKEFISKLLLRDEMEQQLHQNKVVAKKHKL